MKNKISVIIFDKMTITKVRIKKIFESQGIKVNDAVSAFGITNTIAKNDKHSHILIINTNHEVEEEIFEILKKIKAEHPKVPVVILTSKAKRDFFIRCVSEGASDYILKPFEDYYLSERVLRLLKSDNKNVKNEGSMQFKDTITFNFEEYLNSEMLKAKKGQYSFTILKSTLAISENENTLEINHDDTNKIFNGLKTLFWDTDIFVQYNQETFLGYFPFCPEDNTVIIEDKMKKKFEEIKINDEHLKNYDISNVFVTFPTDGTDSKTLIDKLFSRSS